MLMHARMPLDPPLPCLPDASELEFLNRQAKGQQKKGAARQRRYDDLVTQAQDYVKTSSVRGLGFWV